MNPKILVSKHTLPRIRDISTTLPRVDPSVVAKALGAEPTTVRIEEAMGPLTLFLVREKLIERLQSSGGRPALLGTTRRAKIPLSDEQWMQLEDIATSLSSGGITPSAGQVASVLLSAALESIAAKQAESPVPNS